MLPLRLTRWLVAAGSLGGDVEAHRQFHLWPHATTCCSFIYSIRPSFRWGQKRRPSWPFFFLFIAATHCNSPLMYRCVCRSTNNEWHFMPSTSFLTTVRRERNDGGHRTHPPPDLSRLFFWLAFLSATSKKSILFINQKQFYFLFRLEILSWGGNPWLPSASGELLTKIPERRKGKTNILRQIRNRTSFEFDRY